MLRETIQLFNGKIVVVSSATNNGTTSFVLYAANTILSEDKLIVYYNPSADIDRQFVERYYPRVAESTLYVSCSLCNFFEFLQYCANDVDVVIIDPGDTILVNRSVLSCLALQKRRNVTLFITSQIRQDPTKAWSPYSTIERVGCFDYSVWITNVTGDDPLFEQKYIDIFDRKRNRSNFIIRDIAYYTKEGNIVEVI